MHAVAEEGVPTRAIAEAIGAGLGLPVVSVSAAQSADHFGWFGRFFGADASASNTLTRESLGWEPTGPGLLADLDAGHYFAADPRGGIATSHLGDRLDKLGWPDHLEVGVEPADGAASAPQDHAPWTSRQRSGPTASTTASLA